MKKWIVLLLVGCLFNCWSEEPAEKAPEKKEKKDNSEYQKKAEEQKVEEKIEKAKFLVSYSMKQNGYTYEEIDACIKEWKRTGKPGEIKEKKMNDKIRDMLFAFSLMREWGYTQEERVAYMKEWKRTGEPGEIKERKVEVKPLTLEEDIKDAKILVSCFMEQDGCTHEEIDAQIKEWEKIGEPGEIKEKVEEKVEEKKVEESKTAPEKWKNSPEYQEKIKELREKSKIKNE
jgi:hypothetical protein